MKKTPLNQHHIQAGGKMVDFAGWEMPIPHGSHGLAEHEAVRTKAGMFDVAHMQVLDIHGTGGQDLLRKILSADVAKLAPKQAIYNCMMREDGGILDDLIVYFVEDNFYRLIVNAATAEKDTNWVKKWAQNFEVTIKIRDDLSILALQGPQSFDYLKDDDFAHATDLKPFTFSLQNDVMIAKTGYTGETGVEIVAPHQTIIKLWEQFSEKGVTPCGLAARDTLRLEAGLHLYGNDMDETTTPLERGLGWTVDWSDESRDFVGKTALLEQKPNVTHRLAGLVLEDKGVLRAGYKIISEFGEGITTSGGFSPTLKKSIALASIPKGPTETVEVEVYNKKLKARVVKPNFVRFGQSKI